MGLKIQDGGNIEFSIKNMLRIRVMSVMRLQDISLVTFLGHIATFWNSLRAFN